MKAKSLVQDIKKLLARAQQIKADTGVPGLACRGIAYAYRRWVRPWIPVRSISYAYQRGVRPWIPIRSIAYAYRRWVRPWIPSQNIAYAYQRGVRPWIPVREVIRYAGIPVYDKKWGDRTVPKSWIPLERGLLEDIPDYETALVAGLRETIRPGDRVVIVGGGWGVTTVVAALVTGQSGAVQCFEGSQQHVRLTQQTAARNKVSNVRVHHAVVAKSILVYGSGSNEGAVLPPSQLPPCDVLQLDCEGAEVEILREMNIQPRVILVETHGVYGAPTGVVASLLEERGYVVSDRGLAEPRFNDLHTIGDVRVLLGIKR